MQILTHTYTTSKPGPTIVILGAVHGNEPCGTLGIHKVMPDFDQNNLTLACGTIIFVPITNLLAYEQQQRFIDRDLNRYLHPQAKPPQTHAHENTLVADLCQLLEQADVLLDLHSYRAPGGPFIFIGSYHAEELAFAQALNLPYHIVGWAAAFVSETQATPTYQAMGTTEYARLHNAIALTVECGHHHNADVTHIAYQTILRALRHCEVLTAQSSQYIAEQLTSPVQDKVFIEMKTVYRKEASGNFTQNWQNLEWVKQGTPIARYDTGKVIVAPYDSYLVLPNHTAILNAEWFYLGIPSSKFSEDLKKMV